MKNTPVWTRRSVLQAAGAGAVATFAGSSLHADQSTKPKGNIKQSVCRWCYGKIPLEKLAAEVVKIGFQSIELLSPEEFKVIKPFGLTCAVMRCATGIVDGTNRKENHERIEKALGPTSSSPRPRDCPTSCACRAIAVAWTMATG